MVSGGVRKPIKEPLGSCRYIIKCSFATIFYLFLIIETINQISVDAQNSVPFNDNDSQVRRVPLADDLSTSDARKQQIQAQKEVIGHQLPNKPHPVDFGLETTATSGLEITDRPILVGNDMRSTVNSAAHMQQTNDAISRQTRATTKKHTTTSSTPSGGIDVADTTTSTTTAKSSLALSKSPADELDDSELERLIEERKRKKKKQPEPSEDDTDDDDDDDDDDSNERSKRKKSKHKHRTTTSTTTSNSLDTSTATQQTNSNSDNSSSTPAKYATEAPETSARAILPTPKTSRRRKPPTEMPTTKSDINSTTTTIDPNRSLSSPKPLNVSTDYLKTTAPWSSSQDLSKYLSNSQRRGSNQGKVSNPSSSTSATSTPYVTVGSTFDSNSTDSAKGKGPRSQSIAEKTNNTSAVDTSFVNNSFTSSTVSTGSSSSGNASSRFQGLNEPDKSNQVTYATSTTPMAPTGSTSPNHLQNSSTESGNGTFSINIATTPSSMGTTSGKLQDFFEQSNRTIAELIKDIKELHVRVEEGPKDQTDSLRNFIIFCSIVARSNLTGATQDSSNKSVSTNRSFNVSSSDFLKSTTPWFSYQDLSKYQANQTRTALNATLNTNSTSNVNDTDRPLFNSTNSNLPVANTSTVTSHLNNSTASSIETSDFINKTTSGNSSSLQSPNGQITLAKESFEHSNKTLARLIKDMTEEHTRIEEGTKEQTDSLRHFIIICSIAVVVATSLAVALILLLLR